MTFAYITKGDRRFYRGLIALVNSLRICDSKTLIVVFDCGLTLEQVERLNAAGCEIVPMPFRHTSRPATIEGTHYNDSIYALMHIASLDVDAFVHLDADTVVFPPVGMMAEMLEKVEFIGVTDHPALTLGENIGDAEQQAIALRLFPIACHLDRHAINAGVFGARMTVFRELALVMQRAYESELELPRRDQTLLNIALAALDTTFVNLGIHFNFRHVFRRDPSIILHEARMDRGFLQPYYGGERIAVMHYIGPNKPWMDSFDKSSVAFKVWGQFSEKGDGYGTGCAVQ